MANNQKTRTFEIPKSILGAFFTQLEENDLEYELIEVLDYEDSEDEVVIEVSYTEDEKGDVMDLIEVIDDHWNENEEEEDDEN